MWHGKGRDKQAQSRRAAATVTHTGINGTGTVWDVGPDVLAVLPVCRACDADGTVESYTQAR